MATILARMKDGLLNAVSGIGTSADVRKSSGYTFTPLDQHAINSAYRGSGMMRKCIDIPALDMVRAWREWNAEGDDLEQIEKEEDRLGLRQKIYEAEILRGLGGGAIIIGAPGEPSEPLGDIGIGQLAYLHVISRYQITIGEMDKEPFSPNYGLPKWFTVNDGAQTRVDPSRVVCFTGDPIPQLSASVWEERFWGEPRIQRLLNAVTNSDTAQDVFAALLHKARVVRVGIPKLTEIVGDPDGEALIGKRLAAMALGESIHNATIYDSGDGGNNPGETIDDYQVSWTGMSDVMSAFDKRLCAVADIPATRLLGESPGGLNASGAGQQQDWHKHVQAMQELRLRPCLDKIDRVLVQSATGKKADMSNWYSFAPLDVPDEKALAETFKLKVEAAVKAQETGAIPDEAFAEGFQSMIVESGMMPALETALERVPEAERFGFEQESPDDNDDDPSELTNETEAL